MSVALIARTLASTLELESDDYSIIAIEGMHRVGKTTLARNAFADLAYVDLADLSPKMLAKASPREFFALYGSRVIIDNIEAAPALLEHLPAGPHVKVVLVGNLTDEQRTLITDNGAGKSYTLMPLSQREVTGRTSEPFAQQSVPVTMSYPNPYFLDVIRNGSLPRPALQTTTHAFYETWLAGFFDQVVRNTMHVAKEALFFQYLKALANNNMCELNHYALAQTAGISYGTAMYWTRYLVNCGLLLEVPSLILPQRRQVKRPKVCFSDSGLLCHLLGCVSSDDIAQHASYAQIIEGFIVAEIMKGYRAWGQEAPIFFYRDTSKKHISWLLATSRGYLPMGLLSAKGRDCSQMLREMLVLSRMGETVTDPVLVTDGTLMKEHTEIALLAATDL